MHTMKDSRTFDDIRPYRDDEIPAAMQRIVESTTFPLLASYVFPNRDLGEVRQLIKSVRTIDEFQSRVMFYMNEEIIRRTMTRFTWSGMEHLSPEQKYLFIGNHRDIVLDSSLMEYVLYKNGHETSEITFGANLMQSPLIVDIGKANKMFRVERPGNNLREFYCASARLSEYIRYTLREKHQSVWIAQRNGRTKDGLDLTDQGVVKMLGLSRTDNKVDALDELHIVPLAISYEWEPCDILKALELYEKKLMGHYVKKPGEDVNSILTGITQFKGNVHLHFCEPLQREELALYDGCTQGDFHRAVARLIDRRIHHAYRLMPNNYIAHDLRYGRSEYADRYTAQQKADFLHHLESLRPYEESCDPEQLTDLLLGIYANPIESFLNDEASQSIH